MNTSTQAHSSMDSSSSQKPSHSPQNPDTDEERLSVQSLVQQFEERAMGTSARREPASSSREPSAPSPQNPGRLSVEKRLQMFREQRARQALAEGKPALMEQEPSKEKTEVQLTRPLKQTVTKLYKIVQNTSETNADLRKQLEEEKMRNEAQRKEIERREEQLRKEREESEVVNQNLMIAQGVIMKLQSELETQRQSNMELQVQLQEQRELAAARSPSVQDPGAQPKTIAKMQHAAESSKQQWKELLAAVDKAEKNNPSLQGDSGLNLEEAPNQGTPSGDERPSVEDTEVQLRQQLDKTTAELQEKTDRNKSLESTIKALQEDSVKKDADLLKQKEEKKMLHEELRRVREEREVTNRDLMIAHKANEQLQSDLQFQKQTNNDLQQHLSRANAEIAEMRDVGEAWRQSVQEEMEKKEREWTQNHTILLEQLSSANAKIAEMRAMNETWKQLALEESEKKEEAEKELVEMWREEKGRKKRKRWWRFWRSN